MPVSAIFELLVSKLETKKRHLDTLCVPLAFHIPLQLMRIPRLSVEILNLQQFGMSDLPQRLSYNR